MGTFSSACQAQARQVGCDAGQAGRTLPPAAAHWSRSSVETFHVQDEGTTFRYRSPSLFAAVTTGIADANIPAAPVARTHGGI
jgi:hypothetical protein